VLARPADCGRKPSAQRVSTDGACAIRRQFLSVIAPADDSAGGADISVVQGSDSLSIAPHIIGAGSACLNVRCARLEFQRDKSPFLPPSAQKDGLRKDVADELCALGPALDNDLSVMKGFEFGPMTNANDGRVFELLEQ
jgi:hypothetical protein